MIILELMRLVLLTTLLCLTAITDIRTRLIPKELLLEMVVVEAGYLLLSCFLKTPEIKLYQILVPPLVGFLVAALLCLCCRLLAKDGIGGGDLKLLLALGFCYELQDFLGALAITALLSLGVGAVLLLSKKIEKGATLPFAPFLAIGVMAETILQLVKLL